MRCCLYEPRDKTISPGCSTDHLSVTQSTRPLSPWQTLANTGEMRCFCFTVLSFSMLCVSQLPLESHQFSLPKKISSKQQKTPNVSEWSLRITELGGYESVSSRTSLLLRFSFSQVGITTYVSIS